MSRKRALIKCLLATCFISLSFIFISVFDKLPTQFRRQPTFSKGYVIEVKPRPASRLDLQVSYNAVSPNTTVPTNLTTTAKSPASKITSPAKISAHGPTGLSSVVADPVTKAARNCTRKKNIVFIKTHKTASTAVQNVLLRYGLSHDLRFALPHNKHDFNYPAFFKRTSIAPHGTDPYNVMCHHMRFRYDEVRQSMPADSVFVTIVREPGELFESTFDYFWPIVPAFQRVPHLANDSMERWLDHAAEHFRSTGPSTYKNFCKSSMFFDLGYSNMNDDDDYINKSISELDGIFQLVMVSNHFYESMVLFADLLCWDLEDVACLNLNARNRDDGAASRHARIREKARRWNKADAALYDHFNATLWRKVEEYGRERMERAVAELKAINSNLTALCIEGGKAVDSSQVKDQQFKKNIFKPKDVAVKSYNLKPGAEKLQLCRQLIEAENVFSARIFEQQKSKAAAVKT